MTFFLCIFSIVVLMAGFTRGGHSGSASTSRGGYSGSTPSDSHAHVADDGAYTTKQLMDILWMQGIPLPHVRSPCSTPSVSQPVGSPSTPHESSDQVHVSSPSRTVGHIWK